MTPVKRVYPAKGSALWTPVSAFGATLLTPQRQESMKGINPDERRSGNGTIVAIRATQDQKAKIREQADLAGMNVSNYIRHKLFGGRPLVAKSDLKMLGELRRFAGLLKHQCQLFREQGGGQEIVQELNRLSHEVSTLISKIGLAHDSQKDQD